MPTQIQKEFRSEEANLKTLAAKVESLEQQLTANQQVKQISLICFSGEWDRIFAALAIANGALSLGMEVHLFFTFWATSVLRLGSKKKGRGKGFLQALFGWMLPRGMTDIPLSKYNFFGLGKIMVRKLMRKHGVMDINEMYDEAKNLGVHIHLCDTTALLFGLTPQELDCGNSENRCGVTSFLDLAQKSKVTLFI